MTPARKFPQRPCPVCSGTRRRRLFRQNFEAIRGARFMDGYDVTVCRECGAGFADDIPPQVVFDEYYRRKAVPGERDFRDIAGLIAEFIPSPDARVREADGGSGSIAQALGERGFRDVAPLADEACDFLVLTDVLEHTADVGAAMARYRRLLRPGGLLYAEVPDATRYESRGAAPFQEFSVEHVNFFSAISLINLFRARGLRAVHNGWTVRPLHEANWPCTYAVFENAGVPAATEYDHDTEPALRRYVSECKAEDVRIRERIRESLGEGGRVIVWGTGTHTLRLLASGGLDPAAIAAFVDSDPKYRDYNLRGIPVCSPQEVRGRTEPILISSRSCQEEIHHQIRDALGMANRVIVLYGDGQAGCRSYYNCE